MDELEEAEPQRWRLFILIKSCLHTVILLHKHLAKPTAAVLPFKMTKKNSKQQEEWWTFKAMTVGRHRSRAVFFMYVVRPPCRVQLLYCFVSLLFVREVRKQLGVCFVAWKEQKLLVYARTATRFLHSVSSSFRPSEYQRRIKLSCETSSPWSHCISNLWCDAPGRLFINCLVPISHTFKILQYNKTCQTWAIKQAKIQFAA